MGLNFFGCCKLMEHHCSRSKVFGAQFGVLPAPTAFLHRLLTFATRVLARAVESNKFA
jgi:hypothetical protein